MPTHPVPANATALPSVSRRPFLKGLATGLAGAVAFTPFAAAGAAAPNMETPEDRIRHHIKGLEEAFADYYGADMPITPTFSGTTPEMMQRGPHMAAYAIVRAGPRLYPHARTFYGVDDGPLFAEDR